MLPCRRDVKVGRAEAREPHFYFEGDIASHHEHGQQDISATLPQDILTTLPQELHNTPIAPLTFSLSLDKNYAQLTYITTENPAPKHPAQNASP